MKLVDADELVEKMKNTPPNGYTVGQMIYLAKNAPTVYDADEVALAMEKQIPYKIIYKNGFGHCKCGCEFESEGYKGEEYCNECGQKVWVGGYNGEENKIVRFSN